MDGAPNGQRALTPRQRDVLGFIDECARPPTMREICERFGWASTMAATVHVRALEKHGYIVRQGVRGLRSTKTGRIALGVLDLPFDLQRQVEAIMDTLAPLDPVQRGRVLAAVRAHLDG